MEGNGNSEWMGGVGKDYSKHLLLVLLPSFHHETFLFPIFTLVLFFDQIYFSLHFDELT